MSHKASHFNPQTSIQPVSLQQVSSPDRMSPNQPQQTSVRNVKAYSRRPTHQHKHTTVNIYKGAVFTFRRSVSNEGIVQLNNGYPPERPSSPSVGLLVGCPSSHVSVSVCSWLAYPLGFIPSRITSKTENTERNATVNGTVLAHLNPRIRTFSAVRKAPDQKSTESSFWWETFIFFLLC
jgi:hypothetical protein